VEKTEPGLFANDIATAPGDLPMPDVLARFASRKEQFRHDNNVEPLGPKASDRVRVWATSGTDIELDTAVLFYTTDSSDPDIHSSRVAMTRTEMEWEPLAGYLTRWSAEIPALPAGTIVRYRIGGWKAPWQERADATPDVWAHDGQGYWFRTPGESGVTTFAYEVESSDSPMPEWMKSAVIYHIFLDRFHSGAEDGAWAGETGDRTRHGGNLEGVRRSLPYLAELGITCIWLSPLHPSETYHRYDGIDFFEVDSDLGTVAQLSDLVGDAHRLGIRLWLDFVPSHVSWRHPAFEMARADPESPTFGWFTFNEWPDDYRSFLQASKYLPSLNTEDPGARKYLIDAAVFWLKEVGVDGFRLDHAIAPSFDFWVAFRRATEHVKADVVNVGEATDTPDCLRRYRGRLHGVLDFQLAKALRLTFGAGSWGVTEFDHFLSSYERFMEDGPGRVSFLDNHDMDRFLWVAGNNVDRLKLAALCQFTLSPNPVVYYGTEIGMSQRAGKDESGFGGDVHARRDMRWNTEEWNLDLLEFYKSLTRLRRESEAVAGGHRTTTHLDEEAGTYGYMRTISDDGPANGDVLTLFNLGVAEKAITLPLGQWSEQLRTNDRCVVRDTEVVLPPLSGVALYRRRS
jgi:glycosidase